MGRRSKVRLLPPELRKELDRLLADDRLTHADITNHLAKLGAELSESSVQRYSAKWRQTVNMMRRAREGAKAFGQELGDDTTDVARLAIESLQSLLVIAQNNIISGDSVDTRELRGLAEVARNLGMAMKANVDTELRIRERVKKEAARVAADGCKHLGLTREVTETIKARILGIGPVNPS